GLVFGPWLRCLPDRTPLTHSSWPEGSLPGCYPLGGALMWAEEKSVPARAASGGVLRSGTEVATMGVPRARPRPNRTATDVPRPPALRRPGPVHLRGRRCRRRPALLLRRPRVGARTVRPGREVDRHGRVPHLGSNPLMGRLVGGRRPRRRDAPARVRRARGRGGAAGRPLRRPALGSRADHLPGVHVPLVRAVR